MGESAHYRCPPQFAAIAKIMEELVERYPEPTPHFASELVAHLYDDEGALPLVTGWLERSLRSPLLEVMQQEHRHQAVQQTALTNAINSCRRLAQIQWRELFQSISWAESQLAADPAGVYAGWILRRAIDAGVPWRKSPDGQIVRKKESSITLSRRRRPRKTKLRGT